MISESRLRQQLALDTPDAFNVFGGPGANSEAVLDAVRIDNWRTGEASLGIVDAKATGDLFEISGRSEEHTSELQSLMRNSYAVFCLKKKNKIETYNQKAKTKIRKHIQQ